MFNLQAPLTEDEVKVFQKFWKKEGPKVCANLWTTVFIPFEFRTNCIGYFTDPRGACSAVQLGQQVRQDELACGRADHLTPHQRGTLT